MKRIQVEEIDDKHEKEVGDTEVKDDNSTQQINSTINSSDDKDDVSTEVSGTNNDKQEEEVDKASVKPRKQKKNDSICLKKGASVKNVKMFKCVLCRVKFKKESELEDHIQECYCMDCDLKFKCKDEYDFTT